MAGGKRHTSDRQALLPGFVRCLGISLEPQLSLGMDLIAVRFHRGEGLHRDILDEGAAQGVSLPARGPLPSDGTDTPGVTHKKHHALLMAQ